MVIERKPSCFYMVFHPELMGAHHLKIPSNFVKHTLKGVTASRAQLTGPSGRSWSVKLRKTAKGVFLRDGWEEFACDNLVKVKHFLVFNYDGDMRFNVQIFYSSGLASGACSVKEATTSSRGVNTELNPVESTHLQLTLASECRTGAQTEALANCGSERKRARPAAEAEARKSFSSQFPFFERLMKDYNVKGRYLVNIPKSFTDVHFPKDKSKLILKSLDGKAWGVNCRVHGGRFVFGAGWRSFVVDHKLKVGDVCIFEVVGEMELQVHIFKK